MWRDSEDYSRSLDLSNPAGNFWGYYLGRDEVVRQVDITAADFDREEKLRAAERSQFEFTASPIVAGRPDPQQIEPDQLCCIKAVRRGFREETRNQRLAEDTGINNQPITPDEMIGLRGFCWCQTKSQQKSQPLVQ